jgi:hypothetical protein
MNEAGATRGGKIGAKWASFPASRLAVPLAALAFLAGPGLAFAQGASREVRDAGAQVVTLRGYDAAGQLTAQGSGFFFGPGRIATNFHVIAGASVVFVVDATGDTIARVRAVDAANEELDLAILPSPVGAAGGLRIESFLPAVGDQVWTYGSPKGLTGTMSDGIVSAVRERGGPTVLQISAPISPGSSGGPVLDVSGRVVGVTKSSVRGGQNLNFAVPARELARLAARRGEAVPLPVGEVRQRAPVEGGEAGGEAAGERPELPDRWALIARNASNAELFYDQQSLRRDGRRLHVWVYAFYPETLMAGEAAFDASKALFELRCNENEFRLNQYLLLRGEKVIGSNGSVSGGEWSAVAPESVAESLAAMVCREEATATPDGDAAGE